MHWSYLYQDIVSWLPRWVRKAVSDCSLPRGSQGGCRRPRPPWCWSPGWGGVPPGPSRPQGRPASRSDPRKVQRVLWWVGSGIRGESCCSTGQCSLQEIPCLGRPILMKKYHMRQNMMIMIMMMMMSTSSFDRLSIVDHCGGWGAGWGVTHYHW